jgi:hypothetical protein
MVRTAPVAELTRNGIDFWTGSDTPCKLLQGQQGKEQPLSSRDGQGLTSLWEHRVVACMWEERKLWLLLPLHLALAFV